MKKRSIVVAAVVMTALAGAAGAKDAAHWQPTRMADGKPSFEGVWTNASITTLQRPARFKELIIPADQVEAETNSNPQVVRQRNDDNQGSATVFNGSDLSSGRGYNAFWIDPGMRFSFVKGTYRTSWIVDPVNGQIPFKPDARRGPGNLRNNFDGPEARPVAERCIMASGSAGPPMTNYLYNNNYEIVQTRDTFGIRAEMIDYLRTIRIGGKHVPASITPLHGDAIGHWEGDTLVVETTNFHPLHERMAVALSSTGKVTERFTRASKQQILYEYTVDDPKFYTQPWRGEMSLDAIPDKVYEYACHEGNYALTGTLAGAREQEKRGEKIQDGGREE
jgi:hypothetical protein